MKDKTRKSIIHEWVSIKFSYLVNRYCCLKNNNLIIKCIHIKVTIVICYPSIIVHNCWHKNLTLLYIVSNLELLFIFLQTKKLSPNHLIFNLELYQYDFFDLSINLI